MQAETNSVFSSLHFTFLGLGLIGGTIAKALRRYFPDCTIYAYDSDMANLSLAKSENVIDVIMDSELDFDTASDVLFLCAPVGINIKNLKKIAPLLPETCLVTDVGSVKGSIHQAAKELHLTGRFIGGHPMTGSEKNGFCNANPELLVNAYYILTPEEDVCEEKIVFLSNILSALHALVIRTDCQKHDYSTAAISHVPHLIAAALVKLVMEHDSKDSFMKTIAAGGFKDITRIASSSPTMWQHICESNTENISLLLTDYILMLQDIQSALSKNTFSDIYDLFAQSGNYRNSINDRTKGSILKDFRLYLDIRDETGAIAKIATLLADHKINIKNIGITHNRELGEGVLYIAFYDEIALQDSIPLLKKEGYTVFFT